MTGFGLDPRGNGPPGATGGGPVAPPALQSNMYDAPGQTAVLEDVFRAGLDPTAAFGAAWGMKKLVGSDPVSDRLNSWAGNPQAPPPPGPDPAPGPAADAPDARPQTSMDGSAGSPMDGDTTHTRQPGHAGGPSAPDAPRAPAPGGGEPPRVPTPGPAASAADDALKHGGIKESQAAFRTAMAERGVVRASAEGGVLAARRGAQLGSKIGAQMLLRAGAMSLPGLGTALTVAFWVFDSSERKAVNNLISSLMGPGAAPAIDAPPEPPRTQFLPLTHDGNRDPSIERMDQGMVRTNAAAFRFHPDDVWPSTPAIATTSDFSAVAAKANALSAQVGSLVDSLHAAYSTAGSEEPYVQQMWARAKTGVDALDDLKATVLPAIGRQLMEGANNANNAYQAFREVNQNNRVEINNSTSGLIPFTANHVNEAKMGDSTAQLKSAVEAMDRTAQTLASAADPFAIRDYHGPASGGQEGLGAPTEPTPAAPPVAPVAPPPVGGSSPLVNTPPVEKADQGAKDLASLLRNATPQMPGMGMPTMPQMPGMGGMPQVPGLGGAKPNDLLGRGPLNEDALKKALDDRLKEKAEKDEDKNQKKPGEGPAQPGPVTAAGPAAVAPPAQQAGHKVPGPEAGAPGTPGGPPGAANVTEIGGKKYTFDTPKLAAMAHNLSGTDGSAHTSLRQAASEAGFRLPPPGQDIGTPVPGGEVKPGDVVMGANNQNAQIIGDQDGKAMVITERGEVKPLDEVAHFTGPHEGIFRLVDDGAPAPGGEQTIQQAAAHTDTPPPAAPAAPAAAPVTTRDTDPGVIPPPPPRPAQPGLDPRAVPPGN